MTPEGKARQNIDAALVQCGWTVQTRAQLNLSASPGVAVVELSFKTGEPDYTLFLNGKAIVQGMAWDMVKMLFKAALANLRKEGVAPPSDKHQVTRKESIELGFCWVKYCGDQKLEEMFLGLRKHHQSKSKPPTKRRTGK